MVVPCVASVSEPAVAVSCHYEKAFIPPYATSLDIPLPGVGPKPARCAGWLVKSFCEKCGRPELIRGNCRKAVCPDCSTTWRYDRVKSVVERIQSYRIVRGERVRHFVISPPPELKLQNLDDLLGLFKKAYALATLKGVDGGLVIFHPYRLRDDKKSKLRAISGKLDGWMPGKFHLWKSLVKLPDWREYVYFSPHFHVLATCDCRKQFSSADDEQDGWIWKGISELRTAEAVLKCSMYLLSHAGVLSQKSQPTRHAIRWFGDLAGCKWSFKLAPDWVRACVLKQSANVVEEFQDREGVDPTACRVCGGVLISISEAPDYWDRFEGEPKRILRNTYLWWKGSIPPPGREFSEAEVLAYLSPKPEHKPSILSNRDPNYRGVHRHKWVATRDCNGKRVGPWYCRGCSKVLDKEIPREVLDTVDNRRWFWAHPQKSLWDYGNLSDPRYSGLGDRI